MGEAYESQLRWCLVRRSFRVNWAPHLCNFLSDKATRHETGDERHNGVASLQDLEGIIVRVLNTTTTKRLWALTRLQVAIKMRAPINGLPQ